MNSDPTSVAAVSSLQVLVTSRLASLSSFTCSGGTLVIPSGCVLVLIAGGPGCPSLASLKKRDTEKVLHGGAAITAWKSFARTRLNMLE